MGRRKKQDASNIAPVSKKSKFIVFNNNQRAIRKGSVVDVAKIKGFFGYSITLYGKDFRVATVDYNTEEERDNDFDLLVSLLNE